MTSIHECLISFSHEVGPSGAGAKLLDYTRLDSQSAAPACLGALAGLCHIADVAQLLVHLAAGQSDSDYGIRMRC